MFISLLFPKDTNELAAADVLVFIREAIQRFPDSELRDLILSKLLEVGEYENIFIAVLTEETRLRLIL